MPRMATVVERVGVLETKVEHIDGKLDELKIDVKEMHDCLDRTGDELKAQLRIMHDDSCKQHDTLAGKITELEQTKKQFTMYAMIALAFAAGAGWFDKIHAAQLLKFLGL
jgi:hypothetical protein